MKNIAELRSEMGMSQRELSAQLSSLREFHFSPSTIALYELGLRIPNVQRAKAIARFFNVRVEDIVFGPDACNLQAAKSKQPSEAAN